MTGTFLRGLAAGAAGTVALDAVGYLDMALRGRPASPFPGRVVDAVAQRNLLALQEAGHGLLGDVDHVVLEQDDAQREVPQVRPGVRVIGNAH